MPQAQDSLRPIILPSMPSEDGGTVTGNRQAFTVLKRVVAWRRSRESSEESSPLLARPVDAAIKPRSVGGQFFGRNNRHGPEELALPSNGYRCSRAETMQYVIIYYGILVSYIA